jgi:hypothetical protein
MLLLVLSLHILLAPMVCTVPVFPAVYLIVVHVQCVYAGDLSTTHCSFVTPLYLHAAAASKHSSSAAAVVSALHTAS